MSGVTITTPAPAAGPPTSTFARFRGLEPVVQVATIDAAVRCLETTGVTDMDVATAAKQFLLELLKYRP